MNEYWNKLAVRINALTLRERFLLFVGVVTVLGAFTNFMFISPLLSQQKLLVAQIDRKSSEMEIRQEEISSELRKSSRERATAVNAEIVKVQGDIEKVELEIAALVSTGSDLAAMSVVLSRVLQRSEKIGLVRIVQVSAGSAAIMPAGGAVASRGGLDITLSGSYLDLMEYLSALEKALPKARWGALRMSAETIPTQITARIVTYPTDQ